MPPFVCTAFRVYRLARGPLNNKTPAVATCRLLCAPPCVCTAFRVYRLARGPLNNKTPAVATCRLLCAPPCVCTAFRVYRLARGPLNNKTPAVATDRLLCAPPCVCTALCVHRLVCEPPNPPYPPPPCTSPPYLPPVPPSPYLPPVPPPPPYLPPYPPYLRGTGGRLLAIYEDSPGSVSHQGLKTVGSGPKARKACSIQVHSWPSPGARRVGRTVFLCTVHLLPVTVHLCSTAGSKTEYEYPCDMCTPFAASLHTQCPS